MRRRWMTLAAGVVLLAGATFAAEPNPAEAAPSRVAQATYRVTLAADSEGEAEETVARLLLMCGCRREPYAELGFHGFVVKASASGARLLSLDRRVARVEELTPDVSAAPPPALLPAPEPAASAGVLPKAQGEASRLVPVPDADATPWQTGTYGYDGSGNITSIGTDLYRYDAYGRVTRADAGGRTQTFTYDRYANLTSITTSGTPAPTVLLPDAATNRLQNNGSVSSVTYDLPGRLLTMKGASPTFTGSESFVYDKTDVVIESTVENVRRVHLYSATDERIATFTVANNALAASEWTLRDTSGKVLRRLNRDATGTWSWVEDDIYRDGQLLAAEVATPHRTLHFHGDHLGSPRLITNHAGAKVALHTYDAFGLEVTNPNQDTERLKFTGHERDAAHVDYMHARYYTGRWGRFLSVDPVLGEPSRPQSWNRYAYALNNPLKFVDPAGMDETAFTCDDKGNCYQEVTMPALEYTAADTAKDFARETATDIVMGTGLPELLAGMINEDREQFAAGAGKQLLAAVPGGVVSGMTRTLGSAAGSSMIVNLGGTGEVAGANVVNVQAATIGGDTGVALRNAVDIARESGQRVVMAHGDALPFQSASVRTVVTNSVPIDRGIGYFGRSFTSSEISRILTSPLGRWIGSSAP